VVTRAPPHAYDAMVQYLQGRRVDVKALYLSSHVIHLARSALVAYRKRLDEVMCPLDFSTFMIIIIINMLMPAPVIVLHIYESFWYSTHRGNVAQSS
jgi:hypothetical protein